jgi:nicotinamide mononucleotide transporter
MEVLSSAFKMEDLSFLWDADFVFFSLLGYNYSFVELAGTLAGLLSVWYGTKNSVLIWYFGFINVVAFGFVFFQINLYAEMLLQVFYFGITVYGLWNWSYNKNTAERQISFLTTRYRLAFLILLFQLFVLFYWFTQYFPYLFETRKITFSTFPIIDSVLASASIIATILMARKKIESWLMWIIIDAASILLYVKKGVFLVALEFFIFNILAVYGYTSWRKIMKTQNLNSN